MSQEQKQSVWQKGLLAFGTVIDLALTMAVPIVGFTLLGTWLDQKYDHRFLFLLIGGVVGIGIAMRIVYVRANEIKRRIFSDASSDKQKNF